MTDRTIDIKQPIDRNTHITMHIEYNSKKWTLDGLLDVQNPR